MSRTEWDDCYTVQIFTASFTKCCKRKKKKKKEKKKNWLDGVSFTSLLTSRLVYVKCCAVY